MVHARRKTPEELLCEAENHEAAIKKGISRPFLASLWEMGNHFGCSMRPAAGESGARTL